MATPPNVFRLFTPGRRRPAPSGGPTGPSASELAFAEAVDALRAIDAPAEIQENIGKDLKDAFKVSAARRPGYEAGKPVPVAINLIDAFTDPFGTLWETVSSPFATDWGKLLPQPDVAWKDSESTVWEGLFSAAGTRASGDPVIPTSLQAAILRWNEGASIRPARIAARKEGVLKNPGLTEMMGEALAGYYTRIGRAAPTFAGRNLRDIVIAARSEARTIAGFLAGKDWKSAGATQRSWASASDPYLEQVSREFERLMRTDPAFAATPEAQMWRYYKNRDLHYQTLNFLKTFQKGGVWGVTYDYVWDKFTKKLGYLYPPKAIEWVKDRTIGKLLTPALNKLTDLQALYKRKVLDAIKKPLENALKGLGEKLGIKALGGLLGRVGLGAVGGPVGIVIGAVAQFVGGAILKELGDLRIVFIAVFAATLGFILFLTFSVFIILAVIVSNIELPSLSAEGAPIEIVVAACDAANRCEPTLQLSSGSHRITWQITVKNSGKEELKGATVTAKRCVLSPAGAFDLKVGESKPLSCTDTVSGTNTTVSNTITFNSSSPSIRQDGLGIVILGNPPDLPPSGWPLLHGAMTQGPETDPFPSHNSKDDREAIDIISQRGDPVTATHNGEVVSARDEGCGGKTVRIQSKKLGFTSIYAHLDTINVNKGDLVVFDQQIGTLGQSGYWFRCVRGAHLHYALIDGLFMGAPYIPVPRARIKGCGALRPFSSECGVNW